MKDIKEQVREVLKGLVTPYVTNYNESRERINQALSQIHELYVKEMEKMLPEERPRLRVQARIDNEGKIQFIEQEYQNMGYNACLAEIKEKLCKH